jgi:hypothetical protein
MSSVATPFRGAHHGNRKKDSAMTRETIDYARLGVEACQAYTEGPTAFADFVRTTLAVAASQYALQTTTTGKLPEPLNSFAPLSQKKQ